MVVIQQHGINPTKIIGIFHSDIGSKNMLSKKDTHLETFKHTKTQYTYM